MKLEANTLEEWRSQLVVFNEIIRSWKVPLSVSASGTPEVLKEGDNRVAGSAHLMAHAYPRYGRVTYNYHGVSLISTCFIPDADKWICRTIRNQLLDEGFAVMPQPETKITHLFENPDSTPEKNFISFGVRMSDDDALTMLLRDFGEVRLKRIDSGVYLGMNENY